jgi:hypothetical protein
MHCHILKEGKKRGERYTKRIVFSRKLNHHTPNTAVRRYYPKILDKQYQICGGK